MIAKLRRRMTVLVVTVLMLVTCGIVFSINYMNWKNITQQAEAALETLAENSGSRPALRKPGEEEPPEKPDGERLSEGNEEPPVRPDTGGIQNQSRPDMKRVDPGQPPELEDALAALSSYYVVTLGKDNSIEGWTSDREDLYTDEQIVDITQLAVDSGRQTGRIGTQFFGLTSQNGKKMLIILDQRLEIMNVKKVLRVTILVASIACLLLCIASWFLIRAMVRPVQDAFDRQRQFVWDASHELKTPLAVIGANADVLEGEIGENEYLGYIQSEVRRTDDLVQNLLTLARMDQGSVKASLQKIDLGNEVLAVALPFESSIYEAGRTFELDVPRQISCMGDPAMVQQLVVILLGNALKYSDEGGTIRLQVRSRSRYRELIVSNTGEGIAPKDLERIFDRFYRVDSSHNRATEGFGLGLSIAKNIVDAHHGKIRAESTPDGWTVFTVSLPG